MTVLSLEPPLLGAEHRRLVDEITGQVHARKHGFRVVVIEGASGVGKSRVVREVYGALVNRQGSPGYWPPLLLPPRDPVAARKRIGPGRDPFVWPAHALPEFLWWDLTCEEGSDKNPHDAVWEFAPFLQRHLLPSALAQARERGLVATMAHDLRASLQPIFAEGVNETALEVAQRFLAPLDIAIPGLGWFANRFMDGSRWLKGRRDARLQLAAQGPLGIAGGAIGQETARQIGEMTDGFLPGVIAFEDIHLMGDDVADLLRTLQATDAGVTVIATAWPEGRARPDYSRWLEHAQDAGVARVVTLDPPPGAEMALLVKRSAPNTSTADATTIATLLPNPLTLLLLLSLRKTQRRIEQTGGVLLVEEDLLKEPPKVADLYRDRLEELPEPVSNALAFAAGCLPHGSHVEVDRFIAQVIAQAAGQAGLLGPHISPEEDLVASLHAAQDHFQWCVEPDPGVAAFREAPLQRAARTHLTDSLITCGEWDRLCEEVIKVLRDYVDDKRGSGYLLPLDDPLALTACIWLLMMTEQAADE